MLKIRLEDAENAIKFAKNVKKTLKNRDNRDKAVIMYQGCTRVIVSGIEESLIFTAIEPCIPTVEPIGVVIDTVFYEIIDMLKKQAIDTVIFDDAGNVLINNIKMPITSIKRIAKTADDPVLEYINAPKDNFENIGNKSDLIQELSACANKDEQRYILNGVLISKENIVATDGRRLGCVAINSNVFKDIIISSLAIKNISDIFKNQGCLYQYKSNTVPILCYMNGDYSYYTRGLDGTYPNWQQVFPKKSKYIYYCNANSLYEIIQKLKIKNKANVKSLELTLSKTSVMVKNQYGFNDGIDCYQQSADETISFFINPEYLDFLKKKDCIKISTINNQQPIIFEYGNYKYIILPMRS